MTIKTIDINDVQTSKSPVVRVELNDDVVEDYAARYKADEQMPPIVVFATKESKYYILGDGMHRLLATQMLGRTAIAAEVREGGWKEALLYALGANCRHGLRRTNDDKRLCVRTALKEWPKMTDANLAKVCEVDDHTVATIRKEMESGHEIEAHKTRMTANGKEVPASKGRKSDPQKLCDANGTEIPMGVRQYWNRQQEVKEMVEEITSLMKLVKKGMDSKDVMLAEINFTGVLADLEKARRAIGCAIPYAVCTQCQGHPETQRGGCRLCLGRGLISKFRWDTAVPEEIKDMLTRKSK